MTRGSRALRDAAKTGLRRAFVAGQRLGVDVLPRHFYSSIPDIRGLRDSDTWRQPRSLVGLDGFELEPQLGTLADWFDDDVRARLKGRDLRTEASEQNGAVGFGRTESSVLYAFVASQRPRRVVQVGAGVSTAVMLAAADEARVPIQITCVDPFPTDYLVRSHRENRLLLVQRPAQEVDLSLFTDLEAGDLLFVDSTHTVKPGSEVNRLVLEVLPRLAPGVWVHFHDVHLPSDYPRDVLTTAIFFWNESVLLHAYLADNHRIRAELCLSWLHYEAPAAMGQIVAGYRAAPNDDGLDVGTDRGGDFPSSIFLRTCEPDADVHA